MPDYDSRRENPYPMPTAAEVAAAPGTPVEKAARNIAVRAFGGIPRRSFLMGDCDHSPVMKGLRELVEQCYAVIEESDDQIGGDIGQARPQLMKLKLMLEDNGCPD